MNASLPATLARAMLPMAPPQSVVHQILTEVQCQAIDAAMHQDKLVDGYFKRACASALALQLQRGNV